MSNVKSKTGLIVALVIVAVIVLAVIIVISSVNGIVALREEVSSAWSKIDVQLQARMDKIPNLVATVKGYAAHESDVLTEIADARSRLAGANTVEEKAQADSALTSALSRLLVVVENYPELKADAMFVQLMDEISGAENRISVARMDYNDVARKFNTRIKTFPSSMFVSMANVDGPVEYFEAAEGAKEAPKVDFGS